MNLNEFPSTPYEGQQLLIGNVTYQYTGGVWNVVSAVKTNLRVIAERLAKEAGLNMVAGSFDSGATVAETTDVIWDEFSGKYYAWGGTIPKVVSAGSTPATSGGIGAGAWVDRTDVTLRSEINIVQKRFSCVTDMIADTSLGVGQIVETIGYYNGWAATATKPKGGNRYEIVAASTSTDDGGSFITLRNGLQAKATFNDEIYAEQFGLSKSKDDNQVYLNNALMCVYNIAANKTLSWDGATHNTKKGIVRIGECDKYTLSDEVYVPAGVTLNLNGSELYQAEASAHCVALNYDTSLSYGYGNFFNCVSNGILSGVGSGSSTKAGLYLNRTNCSDFSDLEIRGFKIGVDGLEVQYSTFKNIRAQYNRVGLYLSAHPSATNLTCIDNNFINCVTNFNEYGTWLQTSSNSMFTRHDSSRNSKVDVLIGKQLSGYISAFNISSGGTGYTASANISVTITDSTGYGAKAYAVTNSSGVVTSIRLVAAGFDYTSPTITIAGGSTLATVTATVSSDTGIGEWDGQATLIRGQNIFDGLKVEHATADLPLSGYAIVVNGTNHQRDVFNDPAVSRQGTATGAYMRWVFFGGRSTTVNNPIDTSALLDYYYCASDSDYSIFTAYIAACGHVTLAPNQLALASFNGMAKLTDGTVDGNNYLIMVMYRSGGLVSANYYAVNPYSYSQVFKSRLNSDTYDRLIVTADGAIAMGSGSSAPDVKLSRGQADRLLLASGDSLQMDGTYNGGRLVMNGYHIWVSSTGKLYMKSSAPTSDTDGTVVGAQS